MSQTRFSLCVALMLMLIVILALAGVAAAQQTSGGIRGIVRDDTGAVLVGVAVSAESPARVGTPAVDVTNSQGLYRFEGFPVGIYTLTFELSGFGTVKRENVRVELGRNAQLDMTLGLAGTAETVTVTAEAPVIDTVRAQYGTNFQRELVENIPTTRNSYFDILTSVPGVKADHESNLSTFSVYGSNVEQNAFQMDGVDTSSVDEGGAWDYPNYDIIEELQVLGIGVSAEYSGFQGAMINIVTKSGSNELRGSVSTYLVSDWMQGNNTPDEEFPAAVDYRRNFNFMLGGPIIKDKLWAIGQFQRSDERDVPVGVELTDDVVARSANKYFFKVNAQLSDKDRLAFTFDDNQFDWPTSPSRTQPIGTRPREIGINPVIALRYTHVFNDSTLLEVSGGGIYIRDDWGPMFHDLETPGRFDWGTGLSSANYRGLWKSHQNKTQVAAALTHYADDFVGSHDFKFGAQFLRSLDKTTMEYNSGVFYYDYTGDYNYYDYVGNNYYAMYRAPAAYLGNVDTNSFFVNDNWTVNDRVTLNLGVRYEHMSAGIPDVTIGGEDFAGTSSNLITFHNISPRVGITVGLDSVGKTVAKASYGRYYGKISTDWFKQQATSNAGIDARAWNGETGTYDIPFWTWDPNFNLATDPNLKNQYTDQFYIGLERELIPDLRLDVSFIIKEEANFIRARDVTGVYEEMPFEDLFEGVTQTLTVFNRVSDSSESLYMSTNRDDFDQSYKSVVIQANKRFSRNWTLNGAYQWQRGFSYAGGGIGVSSQSFRGQGAGGFGADPNDLTNAYGRMPSDATHSFNVTSAINFPYDVVLGARYTLQSGQPFGRVINVPLDQGIRQVLASPRGTYELDATNILSLRFDKDIVFGENRRLRVSFDIFNLFNSTAAIELRNNSSSAGDDFLQQTETIFPRSAMFALRFEF